MRPPGGLSLIIHFLIILANQLGRIFMAAMRKIKGRDFKFNINPRYSLIAPEGDTPARRFLAYAFVVAVFLFTLASVSTLVKIYIFEPDSNFVLVSSFVKAKLVVARQTEPVNKFNEVSLQQKNESVYSFNQQGEVLPFLCPFYLRSDRCPIDKTSANR